MSAPAAAAAASSPAAAPAASPAGATSTTVTATGLQPVLNEHVHILVDLKFEDQKAVSEFMKVISPSVCTTLARTKPTDSSTTDPVQAL